MLKGVVLGEQLLLNWVTLNSAQQEPQQLELDIDHYVTSQTGLHLQLLTAAIPSFHRLGKRMPKDISPC